MERLLRAFYEEYNPNAVDKGGFVLYVVMCHWWDVYMFHWNDVISHTNFPPAFQTNYICEQVKGLVEKTKGKNDTY